MIRTLAPLFGNWQRAVTVILGLGATAGWGMLAVSSQSAAETERQLQEQIATLQDSQKQLLLERDQSQNITAELARLRDQLSSARDEIARLAQSRTQAQLKGPADRLPLDANSFPARLSQTGVSQTGSIRSLPPTPPQAPPRPAQAAPPKPQSGVVVVQAGDRKRQGPEQAPVLKPRG
jgi:septal ring factor EnvC (AmiA/AmiB activator)